MCLEQKFQDHEIENSQIIFFFAVIREQSTTKNYSSYNSHLCFIFEHS